MPPFALAALRFLFAAVPAVFFVRRPGVPWRDVVAYGFAIGVFQFGLLFLGMRLGMPAGLSSLVIQVQVFFTIGLAAWWLHDRLTLAQLVGAAIATAGIVVLARAQACAPARRRRSPASCSSSPRRSRGASATSSPSAPRAGARRRHVRAGRLVEPRRAAAAGARVVRVRGRHRRVARGRATWRWQPWACVLFLSWGATLFGLASWNALLHRYPTPLISPFALLIPVSGLVSGALFLGERLAPLQVAGVALVFAGLAWNVYGAQAREWIAELFD